MFLLKGKSVFSKLFLFSLFLSFIFLGLVWPGVSQAASDTWNSLANLLATPVYWLAWLVGELLNYVIYFFVIVAQYNDIITADPVQKGWVIVRDLCNMFFVIVLLVIAFGTVLKVETYHYKRLLPKFLLMAILINFSKTIAGLLIDMAQIIMLTFVAGFVSITGGNLIDALKVSKYLTFREGGDFGTGATLFGSAVLALIAIIIAFFVVLAMTIILVFRIVALWILVILSPLAYLLSIVPAGQKYASQWWQQFTKYIIVGPIMAFFLWLSLTTASTVSQQIVSTTGKVIPGEEPTGQMVQTGLGKWDVLGSYIIGICLLVGSLVAAQQIGVAGGKMAGDWASKIQRAGVSIPKAGALFAGRRADMWKIRAGAALQKRGEGKETKWGLIQRGVGQVLQVPTRPTVWKEVLKQREARLQRRIYAEPSGMAQNILNKLTLSKERKIDYRAIRRGAAEAEELKEIEASVPYDTDQNKKMLLDAVVAGDTLSAKALTTRAVKNTDINETILDQKILDFMENNFKKTPSKYKKFGITDISQFVDSPAVRQAFFSLVTGSEKEAIELASRIGWQEFANGNFHLTSLVKMDEDTGGMRFTRPEEQGKISAAITLLEGSEKVAGKMKRVFAYEGIERDEKTGRRKGTYKYKDEKTGLEREGTVLRNEKGQWESIDERGKIIPDGQASYKRVLGKELSSFGKEFIPQAPFAVLEDQVGKMKAQGMQGVIGTEKLLLAEAEKALKEGKMSETQLESLKKYIARVRDKSGLGAAKAAETKFPEGVEPAAARPIVTDLQKLGGDIASAGGMNTDLINSLETQLKQFEKTIVEKTDEQTKKTLQTIIDRIRSTKARISEANWDELKEEMDGNIDDLIKNLTQAAQGGGEGQSGQSGKSGKTIYDAYGRPTKEI